MIDEDISSEKFIFYKYINMLKRNDSTFDIIEQYGLSSVEKTDLNRIKVELYSTYDLDKNLIIGETFVFDNYSARIILNNVGDNIQKYIDEEWFKFVDNCSYRGKTVKDFLEENYELITYLYGEEYAIFLEKTNLINSYT